MKIHTVKNAGAIIGNYAIKDEAVIKAAEKPEYYVEETELFGIYVDIDCLYCWKENGNIVILDENKGRFVADVELLTFPAGSETVLEDIRINNISIKKLDISDNLRKDIEDFIDNEMYISNNPKNPLL